MQEHTNSASKKCREKIDGKNCEKRFLYSHEYRAKKWGEKRAKQFFQKTRIVRLKMLGKKTSEKSANNVPIYSHEYRDQKMGGKNARNNFSRNTRIVQEKKLGKKSTEKVRKTFFYIHTNIVTKK